MSQVTFYCENFACAVLLKIIIQTLDKIKKACQKIYYYYSVQSLYFILAKGKKG